MVVHQVALHYSSAVYIVYNHFHVDNSTPVIHEHSFLVHFENLAGVRSFIVFCLSWPFNHISNNYTMDLTGLQTSNDMVHTTL